MGHTALILSRRKMKVPLCDSPSLSPTLDKCCWRGTEASECPGAADCHIHVSLLEISAGCWRARSDRAEPHSKRCSVNRPQFPKSAVLQTLANVIPLPFPVSRELSHPSSWDAFSSQQCPCNFLSLPVTQPANLLCQPGGSTPVAAASCVCNSVCCWSEDQIKWNKIK